MDANESNMHTIKNLIARKGFMDKSHFILVGKPFPANEQTGI